MLLTRTLIVVFVALHGVVYSSPLQTVHDQTNNEYGNIALRTPNWDFLELDSISNIRVKAHLKASKIHGKLNLFNLAGMVGCGTKCNRLYLMDYGNYCGIGGSGRPIDNVDRCCQKHDDCYGRIMKHYNKETLAMYVGTYNWHCNHGKPSCSRYQSCGWRLGLCKCDLAIVKCLNKFGCPKRSNYWPMIQYGI